MPEKIKLSSIVEAMDMQNDLSSHYYHIPTGEIIFITDEEFSYAESDDFDEVADWQIESIKKAKDILESDNYIGLPSRFEIHEYQIMKNFCLSIPGEIGEELFDSIKGSGAFRIFKDNIYKYGLADNWYKYREEAFYEIANEWCEQNEITFIDDRGK
ncbi:UPF0158 family protein [bacterium]|nr:UPF0158 family protein [bacterium]